jgi:hypothetical protein
MSTILRPVEEAPARVSLWEHEANGEVVGTITVQDPFMKGVAILLSSFDCISFAGVYTPSGSEMILREPLNLAAVECERPIAPEISALGTELRLGQTLTIDGDTIRIGTSPITFQRRP